MSLLEKIALLPSKEQKLVIDELAPSEEDKARLLYNYSFNARPKQLYPEWAWYCLIVLSGRGFGKSWMGSNWVNHRAKTQKYPIAIIGKNAADVRDIQVELGDSSIIKTAPPWFRPEYQPSKRRLIWPNGVVGVLYSAEDPDLLRGPQHGSAWVDELAKFQYPQDVWDNLVMGLRLGENPQVVITTTPRPLPLIRNLIKASSSHVVRGSSFENRANLSSTFIQEIINRYDGTRLGRQELYGEVLEDVPGALWSYADIEADRVKVLPELIEIVVAIDPAVSAEESSNETGIIVVGKDNDENGYVLEDKSGIYTPNQWAEIAIALYDKYDASYIVAEVNQGGDLVENNIQANARIQQLEGKRGNSFLSYKKVVASKGKATRAQPISTLYEKHKIHHKGIFPELEDQMCNWVIGVDASPDRIDALVWGFTHLLVKPDIISTGGSVW